MAEYIDREEYYEKHCRCSNEYCDKESCPIWKAPAADVAPVRHGQWEWFDEDTGTPITGYEREWGWRCTHCKEELPDDYDDPDCRPKFRYCCNCGAKMVGETEGSDGWLDHMDTVDAVPVTRCKNCANFRQNASGVCWCDEYGGSITPNDYCSRAVSDKQPRAKVPWEAD